MFDEIINECKGYIERGKFIFTNVTHPVNVYDALVIRNSNKKSIRFREFPMALATIEEHIHLINDYQLTKAMIHSDNIDFLRDTKSLIHLSVYVDSQCKEFDFSPIYQMPKIKSLLVNDSDLGTLKSRIDYSKIKGLESVSISEKMHLNFEKIETLKTLKIGGWNKQDLRGLFCSNQLDTLYMAQCGMHSLEGIEQSKKMQCLYLHYNRSLQDISALKKVKGTLKALRIENCSKIEDFSVLEELKNLELLELSGKNTLPNLQFIKQMKNLKTFIFNVNVIDGDLTPCLDLSYVYSEKNRKHYNLKDKDLPKGKYVRGNESIDIWRRLE